MTWVDCFDRAPADISVNEIREALAERRATDDGHDTDETDEATPSGPLEAHPTRVVADADVLAADVCLDGDARRALDPLYRHSWTTLVASDELLSDAAAVIETVADRSLAADWRTCIDDWRQSVDQPTGDHPALASAYRGGAMHLLSFDEELTASETGAALHDRFPISVRRPDAFALLFDPESLYETEHTGEYPGPDREPRAGQSP